MASDDDIKIDVTLDERDAVDAFNKLENELKDLKEGVANTDQGFSKFQSTIVTLESTFSLVGRGFALVSGGARELFDQLEKAGRIENVVKGFENLSEKAGLLADEQIAKLRKATTGLISDFELMTQANQAAQLGLDPTKFDQLAAAAIKLSASTGNSATEGIESLVAALGRGSFEMLDNLGIVLKVSDAQEQYAAKLGLTVQQLSEAQKAEAFRVVATEKVLAAARELSEVEDSASLAASRVQTAWENLSNEFATSLSTSEPLKESLNNLSEVIQNIDVKTFAQNMSELSATLVNGTSSAIQFFDELADGWKIVSAFATQKGVLVGNFEEFNNVVAEVQAKQAGFTRHMNDMGKSIGKLTSAQQLPAVRKQFIDLQKALEQSEIFRGGVKTKFAALQNQFKGMAKAIKDAGGQIKKTDGVAKKFNKTSEAYGKLLNKNTKQLKQQDAHVKSWQRHMKNVAREITRTVTASRQYKTVLDDLNRGTIDNETAQQKISDLYTEIAPKIESLITLEKQHQSAVLAMASGVSEAAGEIGNLSTELKKTVDDLDGGEVLGAWDNFLNELFNAGGDNDALSASVATGIIGGIANGVQLAGNVLADGKVTEDESRMLAQAAGAAVGAALFAAFSYGTLAPIGAAIGSAIGGLIYDAFNNTTRYEEDKKNVDKWMATVFETQRLMAFIDGELKPVFDFVFDDVLSGEIPGKFNTLSAEGQGAFQAIGFALAELGLTGELTGDALSDVFATNLVGDLFNLKLAVETITEEMGYSFEDLEEAIINTALKGNASFLQTMQSLEGLGTIAEEGIPGQLGAVTQALEQVKEAGRQGGRAAVRSLEAIGDEALELGLTTLPQLMTHLQDSGQFTADEIEKLFHALSVAGIEDVTQLAEATDRQLIGALAELERTDFLGDTFKDPLVQLQEVNSALSEFSDKTIKTKIHVEVELDPTTREAQQAIDAGLFNSIRGDLSV